MAERTVLHIVNGDLYAGAERVQHHLATQLPRHGYKIKFVCLKPGLFPTRLEPDIEHCGIFMRSRVDLFRVVRRISAHARHLKVSLIHSHTTRSALVGSLVSGVTGLPLVHHVHSPATRESAVFFRDQVNGLVERLALRRARILIPVSDSLRQHLLVEGHPPERIVSISNGVPTSAVATEPATPGLTLGTIALFRPRKGIEVLLRALASLGAEGHEVRLLAVGDFEDADYQKQIRDLATTLGLGSRIEWRGYVDDIDPEFNRMHALVLPSLYAEGMPMVILEAMAAGLPILASRLEGIPEVVRHGCEGLLVTPGDVTELAEAIRQMATGRFPLRAAGACARVRQQAEFSDRAMAARVAAIYDRVLANTRASS